MHLNESRYWHDVEEIAESLVELRERLEAEKDEDLEEKVKEFLEISIDESDWFLKKEFVKVLQYTKNLNAFQSSKKEFSVSDPYRFLAECCMSEDIDIIVKSFDVVEYEEISEEDDLGMLELDFEI